MTGVQTCAPISFPLNQQTVVVNNDEFEGACESYAEGMTLRDYFATMAMQGLIASPRGTPTGEDATAEYYAKMAYIMADCMIDEREKNYEPTT